MKTLRICIVAKTDIRTYTVASLLSILGSKVDEYIIETVLSPSQSDIAKARSEQIHAWYKTSKKGDLFLFIDSDQTFTIQDIAKSISLIKTGSDIVCGAYSRADGTITVEPKNQGKFIRERQGELYYGATGFMMVSREILEKIAGYLGNKTVRSSNKVKVIPFFYCRIVKDDFSKESLWLGEDYSFCWLCRQVGGVITGYISPSIGHILNQTKFVEIPEHKVWNDKSVAIYCGKTLEKWSGKKIETGIGGSESAVIRLSQHWVKKGYEVVVYCHCDEKETYNGVTYLPYDDMSTIDEFNILILWRCPDVLKSTEFRAKRVIIDLHDLPGKDSYKSIKDRYDLICVKSEYHASLLKDVDSKKIRVIPNGGAWEDDEIKVDRDPNKLIYASSYDRGLMFMLRWGWPLIKEKIPDAELHIYYGWEGFDKAGKDSVNHNVFKTLMLKLMEQKGVYEHGRISNNDLMKEKASSTVHYYVGDFAEIDCITVRESASVGTIPIVSKKVSVFTEKPYCQTVDGDLRSKELHEKGAERIVEIMKNPDNLRKECTRLSKHETWTNIAERWLKLF